MTRNTADGLDCLPLLLRRSRRGSPKLSVARLAQWCKIAIGTLAGGDDHSAPPGGPLKIRDSGTPRKVLIDRSGGYSDLSGDLPVALPVGLLVGDYGIIHRRLDVTRRIDRP